MKLKPAILLTIGLSIAGGLCCAGLSSGAVRAVTSEVQLSLDGPADLYGADRPSLVGHLSGSIGVIWQGRRRDDQNRFGILGRFFDINLTPLGTDFLVDSPPPPKDTNAAQASAAFTDDGFWVAVWNQRRGELTDEDNIVSLRTVIPGQAVDSFSFVNTTSKFSQSHPSLATGAHSTWSVVWQNEEFEPDDFSVRLRHFDGDTPTSSEISVNSEVSLFSKDGVACRNGDDIYVLWSGSINAAHWDIFASHASESSIIPERLTDGDGGNANSPAAAALPYRRLMVAWREDGGSSSSGIRARVFDSDLNPVSLEKVVWSDPSPSQLRDKAPRLASSPSGESSVVVWVLGDDRANTPDHDIVAQLLNAQGEPEGIPFYVTEQAAVVNQTSPDVEFVSESDFVVVWTSEQDVQNVSARVVGRLFSVDPSTTLCGDTNFDGLITASDALRALATSVGSTSCASCLCDVNGSGKVTSADALMILRTSVSFLASANCRHC